MKMLMIICSDNRQEEVRALIAKHDVHAYSEIRDVLGEGKTGKHLGTHTWPGKSALVFSVVEDGKMPELLKALKQFQSGLYEGEGLRAFVLPVEQSL